jgi:hypothetical protein
MYSTYTKVKSGHVWRPRTGQCEAVNSRMSWGKIRQGPACTCSVHLSHVLHWNKLSSFTLVTRLGDHAAKPLAGSASLLLYSSSSAAAAPLRQLLYGSPSAAAPQWQLLYGSSSTAAPQWQVLYGGPSTAAPLRQLPYGSPSTAAPLRQPLYGSLLVSDL